MKWLKGSLGQKGKMMIPKRMGKAAEPMSDFFEFGRQQTKFLPAPDQLCQRPESAMRVVAGPDGTVLGRGLSAYASSDAERIAGHRSDQIEQILGWRGRDEMVHRDDLVLG